MRFILILEIKECIKVFEITNYLLTLLSTDTFLSHSEFYGKFKWPPERKGLWNTLELFKKSTNNVKPEKF